MEIAEMKRLLNEAKSSGKPIGCAVGLSKDAKTALLLMHRSHQGPEVGRNLKAATPDIVNMRFGTAQIDDEDPKLVRLVLNRPVSGIAKKLVKTLKGTGFNKVKLGLEDGTPIEGAEDEEEAAAQQAATKPPAAANVEAKDQAAAAAPPPPSPAAQEAAAPDADTLKKQLAALAARIPTIAGSDAARTAALVKLAREGQTNIATNNLKYAAASIEQLRRALEASAAQTATTPPPSSSPTDLLNELTALTRRIPQVGAGDAAFQAQLVKFVTTAQGQLKAKDLAAAAASIEALRTAMEKTAPTAAQPDADAYRQSGREWLAARQTVEDELDRLRATIVAAYEGQSVAAEIEKKFREVTAPVLRTLDASFATKLEAAGKAPDAAQRQILVQDAKAILKGYEAFANTKLLADLDNNPFVPLSLQASLTGTLSQLQAALP